MSDMIEGLSRTALEAGQEASRNLTEASALAAMAQQVHAGRRKRRIRGAAVAGGTVAALLAGAFIVPQLDFGAEILEPAEQIRSVVSSVGNLTVFTDDSMSLYTQRGTFVDFPPATGAENAFAAVSHKDACMFDPAAAEIGWTFHVDEARQVLLFARPGIVTGLTDRRTTRQGEDLGQFARGKVPYPTFEMDAEVATAPQLALRETVYEVLTDEGVFPDPPVKGYSTLLDASPEVAIAGDADSFNRVATVRARPMGAGLACIKGFAEEVIASGEPYNVRRYLVVDVFLVDRDGHSMLLATHTSWTDLEVLP